MTPYEQWLAKLHAQTAARAVAVFCPDIVPALDCHTDGHYVRDLELGPIGKDPTTAEWAAVQALSASQCPDWQFGNVCEVAHAAMVRLKRRRPKRFAAVLRGVRESMVEDVRNFVEFLPVDAIVMAPCCAFVRRWGGWWKAQGEQVSVGVVRAHVLESLGFVALRLRLPVGN